MTRLAVIAFLSVLTVVLLLVWGLWVKADIGMPAVVSDTADAPAPSPDATVTAPEGTATEAPSVSASAEILPNPTPTTELPAPVVRNTSGSPERTTWDRLAACEASGDWASPPHGLNGESGGVQIITQTWLGYGGGEFASEAWLASKDQQIVVAERILAGAGPGAWPVCSYRAGFR